MTHDGTERVTAVHSGRVMTAGPAAPHRQIRIYDMLEAYVGAPQSRANVDQATGDRLTSLAMGESGILAEAMEMREQLRADSHLDPKMFALVKIAALVALDAPPASYLLQVQGALDAGATAQEILGVLTAIAPQTGMPRVVAAAPEIMLALGLELPAEADF